MIKQHSIDEVLNVADIYEIVNQLHPLTQKGEGKGMACCPFHNEKTPSFHVTRVIGIYKCFGCGKAGNVIGFVMEHEKKSFVEAVEWLAEVYMIVLEVSTKEESKEEISHKEKLQRTLDKTLEKYHQESSTKKVQKLLKSRGYSDETIVEWGLCFSPDNFRFVTPYFMAEGMYDTGIELGLIKKSEKSDKNYDFLRNRILIPIYDLNGRLVSMAGRVINSEDKPKYLNLPESKLYHKSYLLYGMDRAKKHIAKLRTAILVEGYFDVIGLYDKELYNSVASCGTAFTYDQARLIRRYSDTCIIWYDGDDAGKNAALKAIDMLLAEQLRVKVFFSEGVDPDEYAKDYKGEVDETTGEVLTLVDHVHSTAVDAVIWKAEHLFDEVEDPHERNRGIDLICETLLITTEFLRKEYIKHISNTYGIKPVTVLSNRCKELSKSVKILNNKEIFSAEEGQRTLPKGIDTEHYGRYGFSPVLDENIPDRTGYYFPSGGGTIQVWNFIASPLFHLKGETNMRMVEINNGRRKAVVLMESRTMISLEGFSACVFDEGNFVTEQGTKVHLQKIVRSWGDSFPLCYDLNVLGWQPEGFFAFSNVIFDGTKVEQYNDIGIVQYKEKNFLSPAIATANSNEREAGKEYENDRYLVYSEPKRKFKEWTGLLQKVYPEYYIKGIAFVLATLFRDVILKSTKMPHLYCYGKVESGKSDFAESLVHLFFSGKDDQGEFYSSFNLNEGTEYAYWQRMGRFSNCPNALNEFDEVSNDDRRVRSIKSVYDGEGREKGSGKKDRTITQKIRCSLILIGQYLASKDDNSITIRTVGCGFKIRKFTQEQIDFHKQLKSWENEGLSGILVELLQYRIQIERQYPKYFNKISAELRNMFKEQEKGISTRVLKNHVALYAMMVLLNDLFNEDKKSLGWDMAFVRAHFIAAIEEMNKIIKSSDTLAEFWSFVEYMLELEHGGIEYDQDLKVETHDSIRLDIGRKEHKTIAFNSNKKVLFIRIGHVQKTYEKIYKSHRGQTALNQQTLEKYLSESDAFIGRINKTNFKVDGRPKRTSAMIFDYEKLRVDLERGETEKEKVTIEGRVWADAELHKQLDVQMVKFKIGVAKKGIPGQFDNYTCYWRESADLDNIKYNTLLKATGILQHKSFFKSEEKKEIKWTELWIEKLEFPPEPLKAQQSIDLDKQEDILPF